MTAAPADPQPYADFIVRHLLKDLPPFPGVSRAVAETEVPIEGDNWFWADDNAKVLELLALPEIWRQNPAAVTDALRFVLALCDGAFIFRRVASPRLELEQSPDGTARLLHGLMNVSCDLKKGLVNLGIRFHDGRTARNVMLTGNYVRFAHKGRVYVVDVEEGIDFHSIQSSDTEIAFIWEADLHFVAGLSAFGRVPFGTRHRLGRISYRVTVLAGSMFFDCTASLELDPAIEVSDVTLTIGYDDLSTNDNNVRYEAVRIAGADGRPVTFSSDRRLSTTVPAPGAAYWCIAQTSQISGFALGVHSLPREPARFSGVQVVTNRDGRLHWVASEHTFPGPQQGGARLQIQERKVITAGGFYDRTADYAELLPRYADLADTSAAPLDLSISYDYGAEIASFARCYRVLAGPDAPLADEALRAELRAATDRFLAVYDSHFIEPSRVNRSAIFSRSLAFLAFAYADMVIATGEPRYAQRLREVCEVILAFERPNSAVNGAAQSGFAMGQEHDALPYVDCHASCLLALVRATELLDESAWLASIDRGLVAYRLDTVSIGFCGQDHLQDLVCVDFLDQNRQRHSLHTFWNFTSGLTLRLFSALRASAHPGLREVWARHATRLAPIEAMMRERIGRSLRPRDGAMEIITSVLSAETNSETQPWVALGLTGRVENS